MLIRISLIVAILAGLAVGGLNFVKVKEKITTLQADRDNEKKMKEEAQTELASTKKELNSTTAKLKQTETELAATKEERDTAVNSLAEKTKLADKLKDDLDKTSKSLGESNAKLEAYRLAGLEPEQIVAIKKQFNGLQEENGLLARKIKDRDVNIKKLENELAFYKTPDYVVPLPEGLKGKIVVTDPKWNFVIVDVGQDQDVLEQGELLVNRNGKLVAKIKVRSVQKDRSVANVLPGWQLGEIMEGDQVIPAHPKPKS
jgi:hypothetical protein